MNSSQNAMIFAIISVAYFGNFIFKSNVCFSTIFVLKFCWLPADCVWLQSTVSNLGYVDSSFTGRYPV